VQQVSTLALRLIDDLRASPTLMAMKLIFGTGFVVAYSGALGGSAAVSRAVGGHYLAFIVPSGVLIATFASATGGYMLARDIEDGYLDRLLTTPVSRVAIVLAPMLVGAGYAVTQAAAVLTVGAVLGATPKTGALGIAGILSLSALWGMGVTGYMTATAMLTGDVEITRLLDVCSFSMLFFFAPVLLPREDLEGWLQPIARLNPTTYVLEGLRALMLGGWQTSRLIPAFAAALGFAGLAVTAAGLVAQRRTTNN
jgi:ABC-2 type transport system permease protein